MHLHLAALLSAPPAHTHTHTHTHTLTRTLTPLTLTLTPSVLYRWRGWRLRRDHDSTVLKTYWAFLLLNVFLVSVLSNSVFNILSRIQSVIDHPAMIVQLLANSLPSQAVLFVNYIIVQGVGA